MILIKDSPDTVGDAIALLKRAKETISDEEKWTKNQAFLLDDFGVKVAFCSHGALRHCMGNKPNAFAVAEMFLDSVSEVGFIEFNDDPNTTHADVMNLFDSAIAHGQRILDMGKT